MPITVRVRSGEVESPPELTFDAPRIVIGRGDGCEIRLPDPSVSHRHASIRQRGADYIIVDEGSTNGTFVSSVRLGPQSPRVVRSGELVRIGRVWLELQIAPVAQALASPSATKELALVLVAQALGSQGEEAAVRVSVTEGADAGRELVLAMFEHRYVIGRGKSVDLAFDDDDTSRRHLEIIRRGDRIFVRDLNSKNGSQLAGYPLLPEKEMRWSPGVVLSIGSNRLVYRDPVALALEELERAADEHMAPDDSVDPPTAAAEPEHSHTETEDVLSDVTQAPSSSAHPSTARAPAPIAQRPKRAGAQAKQAPPQTGWSKTDVIVALVALGVLVVSALGMLWLFGGG